ncbi:MAG: type II toxin-antitoxin system RelE/ParE family toxin [Candidatus Gastranaerophilales bacterium]|nr:type II toxin-antitoxin system RelE/ParE family toxin [Candidatus Gastranaerophilales bacterium]
MKQLETFKLNGRNLFDEWLETLKDKKIQICILERIRRLSSGQYGDYKKLDNELCELRLKFGAGYRVYFSEINNVILLLICGGDKSTQKRDIKKAKEYLKIWKEDNND